MQRIWSVICSKSIIDKDTNVISLIESLERVLFSTQEDVKVLGLSFHVVSFWVRSRPDEPERALSRVVVQSPEGELLLDDTPELEINLVDHQRFRTVMRFQVLPYAGNGIYQFIIQSRASEADEWKDEAAVPLEIVNRYTPEPVEDPQAT